MNLGVISYQDLLSKIEEFYDKVGPKYELIYPNFQVNNHILAKSILDNIRLPDNARIADLGCGSGWLLNELAELNPNFQLVGFDISKDSIEFAKQNFQKTHPQIHFQVGDWMNVRNIISEKFDLVICIGNTLTHFTEEMQKDVLKEFSFLLNTNGSALIDTYKDWNERLNDLILFEPKGLTRNKNSEIFSCIFSEYQKNIAIRNICFAHYGAGGITEPRAQDYEQYVTYQFRFIPSHNMPVKEFGFNTIAEVNLHDAINIFSYFHLKK